MLRTKYSSTFSGYIHGNNYGNDELKMLKPDDVDSYIAHSDRKARPHLKEIRKIINSTIPEVQEGISWGVPFYKYHGTLAGFAAYKNHISLGIGEARLQMKYRKKLEEKGYITGNKIIQISYDQEVPATVIKQILKAQVKINEEQSKD